VLRSADAIVWCARASSPPAELAEVRQEVDAAGIDRPSIVAATRADEASPGAIEALQAAWPAVRVVPVSILDDASLADLRRAIWSLTGLIRVWLHRAGATNDEPLALHPPATVADVADAIHHELGAAMTGARIWGPSARFDGQRVGRDHRVTDGDVVEVLA
jgi:ribosome-interacting GTPase 1